MMHIIGGTFKNRKLRVPKGLTTRPTSSRLREALFNICQGSIEGIKFLDLFSGSGAMGLEALSRGAASATFVDNSKESIRCIKDNVSAFDADHMATIIQADVLKAIETMAKQKKQFQVIYADPPYNLSSNTTQGTLSYSSRILGLIDNLLSDENYLLDTKGDLFIEDSVDSLNDVIPLQHLVLKSSRKMGRSALHHYVTRK